MNPLPISDAAADMIVACEISSPEYYTARLQAPTWPGEFSGATVGIGYDLGQTQANTIRDDWQGIVDLGVVELLASAAGATGTRGQ